MTLGSGEGLREALERAVDLRQFAGRYLAGDSDVQSEDVAAAISDFDRALREAAAPSEGPDDEHASWYQQGWEAGYRKGLAAAPFIAQDVKRGSPFAEWAELVGIVATERDEALARLAALREAAAPAEQSLDVERLARALWAWGFDATNPVIRDDVKGPTDGQRRMARKIAAAYAESRSSVPATEEGV